MILPVQLRQTCLPPAVIISKAAVIILTQAFFQAQEITRELQIVLKCDSQSVLVAFSTAGKRKSENESYLKVPEGT